MVEKPYRIAVVGKGGVGKTMTTTLLAKVIVEEFDYKLLLIDADPTHPHLTNMVDLHPKRTLEQIRLEAVKKAHKKDSDAKNLAENIDFDVYQGLAESKQFCLFSIGQPETLGCFCPSNLLLRKVIESITSDFDLILIDCEAGLEQINRMVIRSIDYILIVTDISMRSIETAASLREGAKKFTHYKNLGVVINKAQGNIDIIKKRLEELDLPLVGIIPQDSAIMEFDLEGKPLFQLPNNSKSLQSLREIVKSILNK